MSESGFWEVIEEPEGDHSRPRAKYQESAILTGRGAAKGT